MSAGDFRVLTRTEIDFDAVPSPAAIRQMRADLIRNAVSFGGDSAAARRSWDDPIPAVRDAPPLAGSHPTVLYFTAAGVANPLLAAYLASHGFVVASFSGNGRMTEGTLEFTPNALTLDTEIDDAGFAFTLLRRLPWADTRRLAVASFSASSLTALLWQMRDMQASAIVAIEGWERYLIGAEIVRESVHYDPVRVRVPFLMLERAQDEASPRYAKVPAIVEAMPYADVTRVSFRDAAHVDFLSHVPFGHTAAFVPVFEAAAPMIRGFLERSLGVAAAAGPAGIAAAADGSHAVRRQPATAPVPTEEELYRLAEIDPAAAMRAYREGLAHASGKELFREAVLSRAAVFASRVEDRAAILEIVIDAYPASTAARFALGDARATAGDARARETLRAALALIDADPALSSETRASWRERITARIEGLR
jgi:hypothetical protein